MQNYTNELIEAIVKASTSFDKQGNVKGFEQEKQAFDGVCNNNKQFEPSPVSLALNNNVVEPLKEAVSKLPIEKKHDKKADKVVTNAPNKPNVGVSGDFVSAESLINK